jgi:hypothetical protein
MNVAIDELLLFHEEITKKHNKIIYILGGIIIFLLIINFYLIQKIVNNTKQQNFNFPKKNVTKQYNPLMGNRSEPKYLMDPQQFNHNYFKKLNYTSPIINEIY